jgi:hypothetical protein
MVVGVCGVWRSDEGAYMLSCESMLRHGSVQRMHLQAMVLRVFPLNLHLVWILSPGRRCGCWFSWPMVHALDPFPVFLTLDAGLSMYRSCCYSANAKLIVDRFRTRRSWYESDARLAPCSEHDGGCDRLMSASLVLESCADAQKGEGRD